MPDFSHAPEVFVSEAGQAAAISRAVKKGSLRKLASRLYTRNLTDAPERIVHANLWPIVAAYLPGALIADRTALENRPAADGSIFVVSGHKRPIQLPGISIRPRRGHPPLDSDRQFISSAVCNCARPRGRFSRTCGLRGRVAGRLRELSPRGRSKRSSRRCCEPVALRHCNGFATTLA